MRKRVKKGVLLLLTAFCICLCGCGQKEKTTFSIAEQFGIAYAPLNLMKEMGWLEEKLPGITIEWKKFGGPTAIREAMLSKEVDFGFMGVSPVLIGISNGMDWKYATGISMNQVALVTDKPELNTLADFTKQDKIVVLSPGCTQHVLLCMLAKEQLGDPMAMDAQIVSMSHPDGMNALLSETEVSAHFVTPPYLQEELKHGAQIIADGEALIGGQFTFISGVAMTEFHDKNPELYDTFIETLNEAIEYINNNMEEVIGILAPIYGITEDELREQMSYGGTIYSGELQGVEKIKMAMYEMGFISENYNYKDIVFDNVIWK